MSKWTKRLSLAMMSTAVVLPLCLSLCSVPVTALGRTVCLFAGAVVGWCGAGRRIPSIVLLIGLVVYEIFPAGELLMFVAHNSTLHYMALLMIFCGMLESENVAGYIARRLLESPAVLHRPGLLVTGLLTCAFFYAAITKAVISTMVMLSVLRGICTQCGLKQEGRFFSVTAVFCAALASLAVSLFPFQTAPAAMLEIFCNLGFSGEIPLGRYLIFTSVVMGTSFVVMTVVALRLMRSELPWLGGRPVMQPQAEDDSAQRTAAVLLGVFLAAMVVFSVLRWQRIWAVLAVDLLALVLRGMRRLKTKPLEWMQRGVRLDALLMLAAAFSLGHALSQSGELSGAVQSAQSIVAYQDGGWIAAAGIVLLTVVTTTLVDNVAAGTMLAPVVLTMAGQLSLESAQVVMLVVVATQLGFLLPGSSGNGAVLYANSGLNAGRVFRLALCAMTVIVGVLLAVGIPLSSVLFG